MIWYSVICGIFCILLTISTQHQLLSYWLILAWFFFTESHLIFYQIKFIIKNYYNLKLCPIVICQLKHHIRHQYQFIRDIFDDTTCFFIHLDYNRKWVLSLLVSLLAVAFFIGLAIKHKDTKKVIQEKNKGETFCLTNIFQN